MTNQRKRLGTNLEQRVVEKAQAKGLQARKQPGSGVYRDFPSDCVVAQTLIECKVRAAEVDAQGNRFLRLDLDWWNTVKEHAHRVGMEEAAVVMNPKYSSCPLVLVDLDFFLGLLAQVKKS